MAQQSRSSQPTIRQDLQRSPALNPGIRASGLYSYTEARPSYIDRDRFAGSGMMQLARSLAQVDRSLVPSLERIVDRNIERDLTLGGEEFAQNPDELKNQKNFKDYVEENPGKVNDNPWIQVGYERARLKALAIDEQKAMNDAFVQSGMVNETDQKKVADWVHQFTQDFRRQNHLDTYEDKLTLAENFSINESRNREGLLARHSAILARQNESRAMQQFSELSAKQIEQLFENKLIGHGSGGGTHVQQIAAVVTANAQEALAHGVLDANAGEMMTKAVLDAYERLDRDPSVLKALDLIKTPDGVALSSLPGVQKKLNDLEDQRVAKARADWAFSWQQRDRAEKESHKYWLGQGVMGWGEVAPTKESMDQAKIPPHIQPEFLTAWTAMHNAQRKAVQAAPANQQALLAYSIRAAKGDLEDGEVFALAETLGAEEAQKLYEANTKAQEDTDKGYASHLSDLYTEARRVLGMTKQEADDALIMAATGMEVTEKQQRYLYMCNYLAAISKNAEAEYQAKNGDSGLQTWRMTTKMHVIDQALELTNKQFGTPQDKPQVQGEAEGKIDRALSAKQTAKPAPSINTAIQSWAFHALPGTLVPQFSSLSEASAWVSQNAPEQMAGFNDFVMRNIRRTAPNH